MVRSGRSAPDGEIIQRRDDVRLELARDALINRGRIEEAIGDHDGALLERGPDHFAHELAAAGFEKQQLGLRRHGKTFRRELEEVANLFADRGAAGLARDEHRQAGLFEARREPLDLRRFPATFRAFECDKHAARHQSECETVERSCRIEGRRDARREDSVSLKERRFETAVFNSVGD